MAVTDLGARLLTADDLLRLSGEGVRGELIRGVLCETMPTGQRARTRSSCAMGAILLGNFIKPRRLGRPNWPRMPASGSNAIPTPCANRTSPSLRRRHRRWTSASPATPRSRPTWSSKSPRPATPAENSTTRRACGSASARGSFGSCTRTRGRSRCIAQITPSPPSARPRPCAASMSCPASPARYPTLFTRLTRSPPRHPASPIRPPSSTPPRLRSHPSLRSAHSFFLPSHSSSLSPLLWLPAVPDPPVFIRLRHPGVRGRDPAAPTAPGAPCSPFTAATQPPDPLNVPVRLRPLPFFSTLNSHYSQLTPSSPSPSSSRPRPPRLPGTARPRSS